MKSNIVREQAIELLAYGTDATTAAKKLEIDPQTIYSWRRQKHFSSQVAFRTQEVLDEYRAAFRQRLPKMLAAIDRALDGHNAQAAMKAADIVMRMSGLLETKTIQENIVVELGESEPPK